jgi:hypothetical protein
MRSSRLHRLSRVSSLATGPRTSYRNACFIAVLGVPGAMVGCLLVEIPRFGRKGALATLTALTGIFIYGNTAAKYSNTLPAWDCLYSFVSNIMYAVLYAYSPEAFPTKDRGTGNALAATANRIFGIKGKETCLRLTAVTATDFVAPIIAMFANLETAAPVYTSCALFLAASRIVVILPYESRGRAAL